MPYKVQQNQEIPFNLLIKNEDGIPVLSMPLPTHSTDMTPETAREHPDNGPTCEFAQRVALSLSFVEGVSLMTLAMGVNNGGVKTMAQSHLNLENANLMLKGMLVTLAQCAADSSMTEAARLSAIKSLVDATNYANEPRVQEIMAQSDKEIAQGIADGTIAPAAKAEPAGGESDAVH